MTNYLLLIEDNPQIGEVASMVMSSFGWEVSWVCDVGSALEEVERGRVSVVLLDLGLPDASGLDLIEVFSDRAIPVLVWTVDIRSDSVTRALQLGANGYITKEEPPDVLTQALRVVQAGGTWLGNAANTVVNR